MRDLIESLTSIRTELTLNNEESWDAVLGELCMSGSFFQSGDVICPIYRQVRDSESQHHVAGRSNLERLWRNGAPYVDKNTLKAATEHMPSVFWELFLADTLTRAGKKLVPRRVRSPRNEGPDLLIVDPRVWIEAVMPDGDEALTPRPSGEAYEIPGDAYTLRLTSALDAKVEQYLRYVRQGYVKSGDATVIAVSAARLNYRFNDLPTPRIVSAVFAAGHMTVLLDRSTGSINGRYLTHRNNIWKRGESPVRTDVFRTPDFGFISAILYNPCDWITPSDAAYILIHNPFAICPVPRGWLGVGREFWMEGSTIHDVVHPARQE